MKKYTIPQDLQVFGTLVKTFPLGIGEAFGDIMKRLPDGKNRSYYGISRMDANGAVLYYAAAEEKLPGEAGKYGYERYTIQKGEYIAEAVPDWRNNTGCIKDVFHAMMQDERADNTKPCVEWYKSDNELICMLKADPVKELSASFNETASALMELVLPLDEKQINAIPFKDSWTAAQLATHVTKSNIGIAQALDMEGKIPERDPAARAGELKKTFLNFAIKFNSPDFIVPRPGIYEKEAVIAALKRSNEQFREKIKTVNLPEMIDVPGFGQITKLELVYFVLYHTQRHIHQLKKILTAIV